MKLFNYIRALGAFANAHQIIAIAANPEDRQAKKMLEAAAVLIDKAWSTQQAFLIKRSESGGEPVDIEAEKAKFLPKQEGDLIHMPLRYLIDHMIKKIAAVQNNTSIHNTQEVTELREVFREYGVQLQDSFAGLVFQSLSWSEKQGQKPKVLVHATDLAGEDVCIRLEAGGELAQKFLYAVMALELVQGQPFELTVQAVDPAIARNEKAGTTVAQVGKFVNHNLTVTANGWSHNGYPPKGVPFEQKLTMERMGVLFKQAQEVEMSIRKKAA